MRYQLIQKPTRTMFLKAGWAMNDRRFYKPPTFKASMLVKRLSRDWNSYTKLPWWQYVNGKSICKLQRLEGV